MTKENTVTLRRFDQWIEDGSECAALAMRQWLVSVEGGDAVIFPPTYLKPEGIRDADWPGYNIDIFPDGSSVCQIDSVGSQANRMEPIFKKEAYRALVPLILVRTKGKASQSVNILDAGHRAADAIVRFSGLASDLERAFLAVKNEGNAEPLAKIAPTSLVFGAWDSRDTQVKLPRIVRSVIRAYGIRTLHRSAVYIPPVEYVDEGILEPQRNDSEGKSMSELGFLHAPASRTHGGVQVTGEIRRDAALNLVALRALSATSVERTLLLRRYILGLSLVSLTAPQDNFLREGCQLVTDTAKTAVWIAVRYDGCRDALALSHDDALAYAHVTATAFGVGEGGKSSFDDASAREAISKSKAERKRAQREKAKAAEPEAEA